MLKHFFILILVFIFLSCSRKNETCSVKYINGVKYYSNKNIPADSTVKLLLGNERIITNCDQFDLKWPIDAVMDKDSNLFILGQENSRIHKFDKNMKYVKSFGRLGEGPGEFRNSDKINIVGNDTLAVFDDVIQKSIFFDLNGNSIGEKRTVITQSIRKITPVGNDRFLGLIPILNKNNILTKMFLNYMDHNFVKLQNILEYTFNENDPKTNPVSRFPAYIAGNTSFFVSDYDENSYKINEYDLKGKLISVIYQPYKKERFNYRKDKRIGYFNSHYKRSINQLLFYDNKLLALRATPDTEQREDSLLSVDIFENGCYLNNVKIRKPKLFDISLFRFRYMILGRKFICFNIFDNTVYTYDIVITK